MIGERNASAVVRHRLRGDQFTLLASGGGDEETVSALLSVERSWRLAQLRAVMDAVQERPELTGPLHPVETAWQLLVTADRCARSDVEDLLRHPQAGTWAGYTLRRLRGSTQADSPLWLDLGYLHAIAAVAAIRAGLEFSIRVPMREGFVSLPTLGGALLPATRDADLAEVRGTGDAVVISASGAAVQVVQGEHEVDGWIPLPVIQATAAGHILSVTLDHLDPYRNLRTPMGPDRLSRDQVERWRSLLERAWALIVEACPDRAGPIARGLISVVPQPAAKRFRTMSASAGDAFGSMIVSEPEDAPELAVTIVHEFQHIKLGGLLHLAPLHHAEPPQRLYAPWRDDPRPLGGLLQGVYAFVGIVEFWRGFRRLAVGRTTPMAHFEFARWRSQVRRTLQMLGRLTELTDVGRRLVAGLTATAATWQNEPVPDDILAAAEAAAADHWMRWRLHHLQPDPSMVATVVDARAAGTVRPRVPHTDSTVVADDSARYLDTRAVLSLWRFTDPDGFAQLLEKASPVDAVVGGATSADLAYTAGNFDQARDLFLADLVANPLSPSAWAGLGLVAKGDTADALMAEPELVRAVHHKLGASSDAPDAPLALAAWMMQSHGTGST